MDKNKRKSYCMLMEPFNKTLKHFATSLLACNQFGNIDKYAD